MSLFAVSQTAPRLCKMCRGRTCSRGLSGVFTCRRLTQRRSAAEPQLKAGENNRGIRGIRGRRRNCHKKAREGAKRNAALGGRTPIGKRCRRCALPPHSIRFAPYAARNILRSLQRYSTIPAQRGKDAKGLRDPKPKRRSAEVTGSTKPASCAGCSRSDPKAYHQHAQTPDREGQPNKVLPPLSSGYLQAGPRQGMSRMRCAACTL